MPFEVQALPRGLLNLLEMQSNGKGPSALSETLIPTVDATNLYLAARVEGLLGGISTPTFAFNDIPQLTVPANELWVVERINGLVQSGDAGVTFRGAIAILLPRAGTSNTPILVTEPGATAALASNWTLGNGQRMYLPAGTRIGMYVQDIVGVPTGLSTVFAYLMFTRLRMGA